MAQVTEAKKVQKRKQTNPVKMCVKCHDVKQYSDFYKNNAWATQAYCDAWCKECMQKHSKNKETLREYFWYNNRQWSDDQWNRAQKKAEYMAVSDQRYLTSTEKKRPAVQEELGCKAMVSQMNLPGNYKFYPNITEDGDYKDFDPESVAGTQRPEDCDAAPDDTEVIFSDEWNGWFTRREINYLNNYYEELNDDFVLDNRSIKDYARKVCKASLAADTAQNNYRSGKASFGEVKDAQAQFDMLSKSSNFAACRRKPGDASGITCWAETALKLEQTGHTMQTKIEWPEDDVDKCISELRHIVAALGLDGV